MKTLEVEEQLVKVEKGKHAFNGSKSEYTLIRTRGNCSYKPINKLYAKIKSLHAIHVWICDNQHPVSFIFSIKTKKPSKTLHCTHKPKWEPLSRETPPFPSFYSHTIRNSPTFSLTRLPECTEARLKTRRRKITTSSRIFGGNPSGNTMRSLLPHFLPSFLRLFPEPRRLRRLGSWGGTWGWWSHGLCLQRVSPARLFILLLICRLR